MNSLRTEYSRKKIRNRLFWISFSFSALLGATYPISILLHFEKADQADAQRWIMNDPGFVVHLCLLLPIACGILVAAIDLRRLRQAEPWQRRLLGLLLFTLVLTAFLIVRLDLNRGTNGGVAPFEPPVRFSAYHAPLDQERKIRSALGEGIVLSGAQELPEAVAEMVYEYKAKHPALSTKQEIWSSYGSNAAKIALILNSYAALVLGLFFWYLVALTLTSRLQQQPENSFTWIWAFLGIEALWVPLRVYSEWYRSFGSLKSIASIYPAFGVLVLALAVAIAVSFFLNARGIGPRFFTLLTTAIGYVAGIVAAFFPDRVGRIGHTIAGWGFEFYCVLLIVLGTPLLAMAYSVVRDFRET